MENTFCLIFDTQKSSVPFSTAEFFLTSYTFSYNPKSNEFVEMEHVVCKRKKIHVYKLEYEIFYSNNKNEISFIKKFSKLPKKKEIPKGK